MLERKTRYNFLYDLYQDLLTDRQKQFSELYFQDDLSFAEIAEEFAISRQGVYEHIKRTENLLDDYELKLGLLDKMLRRRSLIVRLEEHLATLDETEIARITSLVQELKMID